ncbi:MAG: hypothetical protein GKR94_16340 [Gammaproteobacteria bacterium]|nr:hypothetical protein [Gammaproteobacteria bacterium]
MIKRRALLAYVVAALATTLSAAVPTTASAADYPDKPITMIVPWKAGGTTETMAQVLSKAMAEELGQKVIVKTKPGGGAAVGATYTARQKADGYTIMYADLGGLIWNPMTKPVKYKTEDFKIIAGISEYQMGLVTTPGKPYKTLPELIEYTKKNPLNVADMGGMSKPFLEFIAKKEGVKWTPIPTRGGGEMVPFLLGGKVDFAYSGGVHQKYGDKMIVLASFLSAPLPKAPYAPSTQDLYGIAMPGNSVLVAPKGVAPEVAAKLEAAAKASMADPDFTKILERIQFPKRFIASSEMDAFVAQVTEQLQDVVDALK